MPGHLDSRARDRLTALCRTGRLFDAQRLLEEVGTARFRKTRKWTPLFTAVDRGFHSFVELLLRYEHAQWDLEKGYQHALRRRRSDLAGLLLRSPWWSEAIDPIEALVTGDLELIEALHSSGTDFTAGDVILRAAMRNASGTLNAVAQLGIRTKEVEDQLYSAMVSHAYCGHVPSVMRFLRSGFDPHRVVVHLDEKGRSWGEESAISASMYTHKCGFFACMRPDPHKDNAEELVRTAVFLSEDKMLQVLLDSGFELNCKANGGSPALDELLQGLTLKLHVPHTPFENKGGERRYTQADAHTLLRKVEFFVKLGARWVPTFDNRNEVRCIRDVLLALGEPVSFPCRETG